MGNELVGGRRIGAELEVEVEGEEDEMEEDRRSAVGLVAGGGGEGLDLTTAAGGEEEVDGEEIVSNLSTSARAFELDAEEGIG